MPEYTVDLPLPLGGPFGGPSRWLPGESALKYFINDLIGGGGGPIDAASYSVKANIATVQYTTSAAYLPATFTAAWLEVQTATPLVLTLAYTTSFDDPGYSVRITADITNSPAQKAHQCSELFKAILWADTEYPGYDFDPTVLAIAAEWHILAIYNYNGFPTEPDATAAAAAMNLAFNTWIGVS